jgi:AsmA-like C-terminal region
MHRIAVRKLVVWVGVAALAGVGLLIILLYAAGPALSATARRRTERYLATSFKSSVQLGDFHASVFPRVHATVDGVVLRYEGRTDIPPLIQISRVTLDAGFFGILLPHPVIRSVRLDGLQIRIPPHQEGEQPILHGTDEDLASKYPVTIGEVSADNAMLVILPRDPAKAPREFELHQLELHSVDLERPANFHAILTNPVPKGEIDASGTFGPWNAEDPGVTPANGSYKFENADLGTLKGLSGILSSTGKFSGPLNYLSVEGETDTPNFSLRTSHHPLALHTDFSAIVDGTNGNTILTSVVAKFLHSTLNVNGEVVDETKLKGRTILLDAAATQARVEDLLRLAVDSDPPLMTGAARLRTEIEIGEGDEDLIERMRLDGQFDMSDTRFTSPSTEQKIETLSLKGQGKPDESPVGDPVSDLKGKFRIAKGVVTFSELSFSVTGASVALTGTYNLDSSEMDFHGKLMLRAKLSQTTTGAKSFFLKAIDPFFMGEKGGTELPIKITGTKDKPEFGLAL